MTHWLNTSQDPRYFQIVVLSCLLLYAAIVLKVNFNPVVTSAIFAASLLSQWLASQYLTLRFEWRSAFITACSLTLLLRTDDFKLAALAAVIAIGSKFVLRYQHKHIFNPTNLAIVCVTLLFDQAWLSTGQWGQTAWFALIIAGTGLFVTTRASRFDVTLIFLASYTLLLVLRALWLGDPLTITAHQLQNGALLIFAFFMITDPGSTPDSPIGRALFASMIAMIAVVIQFLFYQPLGIMYALTLCSLLTPILDRLWPGERFKWQPTPNPKECPNENAQ